VCYRNGELLLDKDLLKGDTVRPMARDLAAAWKDIVFSILSVLEAANDRDLRYGQSGQYNSLNALNVLWCWVFLSRRWLGQHPMKATDTDAYEKQVAEILEKYLDRWLICSQWAGTWAETSGGGALVVYAKELHTDNAGLNTSADAVHVIGILRARMTTLVDGTTKEATAYAQTYRVDRREQVSRYNTPLWIWHRLEQQRWEMSRLPLRSGRRQKCDIEVDHTVAHALWEKMVMALPPKDEEEEQELLQAINKLGNCVLLEKTFNISKSDRPAKEFLEGVHEIKSGKIKLEDWANALDVATCMLDPASSSAQDILDAINKRDDEVRQELVDFVKGNKSRKDLKAVSAATDTN
jgi:hypothetical protein